MRMNNRMMRIVVVALMILGCLRQAFAADLATVLGANMVNAGSTTVTSSDSFQSNVSAASEEVEDEEDDAEIAVEEPEMDDEEDSTEADAESDSDDEASEADEDSQADE